MSLSPSRWCLSCRVTDRPGRVLRACLALLLAACWLVASPPVLAQSGAAPASGWLGQQGEALVLVDLSGEQTLAQVQQRFAGGEATPASADRIMPAGGVAALWYQLALPAVSAPTALVLAVPHPGMNRVDLYRPAAEGGWRVERSGDSIPVSQWPLPYLHPAFELVQQPGEARPSYLRVQHSHPISVRWTVWPARDFQESGKRWHFLLGVYAGFVALVLVICTVNAYFWRDSIHFYYAAYVLVIALGQLSLTGLAGEYFWPDNPWWNDVASNVLPVTGAALGHFFMRELVVGRGARWATHLMLAMGGLGAVLAGCFLFVGRNPFFAISGPYYLASFVVYLGVALWYAWRTPRVGLWVLAGVLAVLAGAVFPVLRNMQLLPVSFMTQYGAQLGVALEIPLLLVALYLRTQERRDNRARVEAMARIDPLTGAVNHRVMLERLHRLLIAQLREPALGAVLRVRIGNLQAIRDEYGLQVAQMALVHAGACITQVAREGDTVARHRDGDFVLILQGRVTRDQISDMGQRLIARGLAPSELLPPGAVLQLKVAIAAAPFQAAGVALLLQALDAAVTEMAARPGKALRFVV
ncbi:7TM diverse intracellular signaling domain-containing protein [Polaromonas sp.]|uniref:sensor domain-containing diguanylate cyclase n=1 Tax=Polaromonas sp. TaxID=1869339 RepID=UPI0024887773|nr:7TM diverse intracellular signaling domain-containing protein [Polaromonas sp.]MDI1274153.1 7TM diverse intracellular signaling domain-containing protein [Polaromonas sp.]